MFHGYAKLPQGNSSNVAIPNWGATENCPPGSDLDRRVTMITSKIIIQSCGEQD